MKWSGLVLGAGLLFVRGDLLSQAPVVRQPPPVDEAQAPKDPDDVESPPVVVTQTGGGKTNGGKANGSSDGAAPAGGFPTIKVETRLVNVALNVVDAKGSPVGGLGRDDFEILEDGKLQKIAVFEKEATTPLSIVLAIDASETVLSSERLEKEAAKHFVRALLREQDELDLMEFADVVREIVPFTNQPKRIEAGLNQIQHGD